jgi:hypothetical protein
MSFAYSPRTFPFHPDCYDWPKPKLTLADGQEIILHVHCIRDVARREFSLVGFLGQSREDQISQVIYVAQQMGAEVIAFKGIGFTDDMLDQLLANMVTPVPDEFPDHQISFMLTDWPTRFQYKVLREAEDMCRHGDFHETSLAYRLHAPVEEIHHHLDVLADLGLMEAAQ